MWIAPLSARLDGDTLRLTALNDFVAGFVRMRFSNAISAAASEVLGYTPVLCISGALPEKCSGLPVSASGGQPAPAPAKSASLAGERPPVPALARPRQTVQSELPLGYAEAPRQLRQWRFNFEEFVVGPCNELAYAAARGMCRQAGEGRGADVLFMCSSAGLGKTHLMQAAGAALGQASNLSAPRIEYLSAEEFSSRFYLSLRAHEPERFKARYRQADVLLLEDVHFMQGKEKMQAELLATIKALLDRGGRVVFSSSFAPRDLRNLDEQLASHFHSGLIASIDQPDRETRKRIVHSKASVHQVLLPEDVEDFLAENLRSDIRIIESCLQNLILKAKLLNRGIDLRLAMEAITNYAAQQPDLSLEDIIRQICRLFSISQAELNSKSRKREYVGARNTAYYLARKHTRLSLEEIGLHFKRSHSTVIKGITSLEREMSRETSYGRQLMSAISIIERGGSAESLG